MSKKGKAKRVFKYITDVISWTCLCILILIGTLLVWYFISAKIYASMLFWILEQMMLIL